MHGQYNGKDALESRRKWYTGTSTLKAGQVLCFDLDDTSSPTSDADPTRTARGQTVTDPVTANLAAVAGLVAEGAGGVTGPCWVDIIMPHKGDVVEIYTSANCTKNTTVLGASNGSLAATSMTDSTFNTSVLAVAIETVDRSSTSGTVLAKFL